jgi:HSP90 family molecular chaperone
MMAKKTLEINPHHSVMKEMLAKLKDSVDEKMDESTEEMANVMYHMALLNSGFEI